MLSRQLVPPLLQSFGGSLGGDGCLTGLFSAFRSMLPTHRTLARRSRRAPMSRCDVCQICTFYPNRGLHKKKLLCFTLFHFVLPCFSTKPSCVKVARRAFSLKIGFNFDGSPEVPPSPGGRTKEFPGHTLPLLAPIGGCHLVSRSRVIFRAARFDASNLTRFDAINVSAFQRNPTPLFRLVSFPSNENAILSKKVLIPPAPAHTHDTDWNPSCYTPPGQ